MINYFKNLSTLALSAHDIKISTSQYIQYGYINYYFKSTFKNNNNFINNNVHY